MREKRENTMEKRFKKNTTNRFKNNIRSRLSHDFKMRHYLE